MKRFLTQTAFFLLILLAIDRSFIVFRYNEENVFADIAKEKVGAVSTRFLSEEIFDILVVGSSHAQFAVAPEIIETYTSHSCLNIAYGDGANIGKQLKILKKIINQGKKKKPKLIIFGMDVFTMNASPVNGDIFQEILFSRSNSIKSFFLSREFNSYIRLYVRSLFRYISDFKNGNRQLPVLRKGLSYNLSMFSKFEKYEISKSGWVKGDGILNKEYLRYSDLVFKPDANAKIDLLKYISLCKEYNIQLVFIQTPEHTTCLKFSKKYTEFQFFMSELSKQHNLIYLNYNDLKFFAVDNDSLFFDSDHLNKNGAELFSKMLSNDLIMQEELQQIWN